MKRLLTLTVSMLVLCLAGGNVFATGSQESASGTEAEFNATGYPIFDQMVTMTMMLGTPDPRRDPETNAFMVRKRELTNIDFEFIEVAGDVWDQRKTLAFASGDLPDIFFTSNQAGITSQEELRYGAEGLLVDVSEMIPQYAPHLNALFERRPAVRQGITTPNGGIYAFPDVTANPVTIPLYLNTKWVEELGLSMPQDLDDLYDVLTAFKTMDPNRNGQDDEIPLMLFWNPGQVKRFMAHWGVFFNDVDVFVDDDGRVVFGPAADGFRDGLRYLNRLYTEGLLNYDLFTITTPEVHAVARGGESSRVGTVFFAPFWVAGEERNAEYTWLVPPLMGPEGQQFYESESVVRRGRGAITSACDYPEAMVRWFDFGYSEEGGMLAWMGVEGEDYEWNEDRTTYNFILGPGQEQYDVRYPQTWSGAAGEIPRVWYDGMSNPYEKYWIDSQSAAREYGRKPFPDYYLQPDDQRSVNALHADIGAYVEQMIARFVTGDASIENEWDDYVQKLRRMGIDELVSIMQKTYDDF